MNNPMFAFSDCDEIPIGSNSKAICSLVNSIPLTNTPFLAPYVPVNTLLAEQAIILAKLKITDTLADLGCGDARILVHALNHKLIQKSIAVELDPLLCDYIRKTHKNLIQSEKLILIQNDFIEIDLLNLNINVMILYLLPNALLKLSAKLKQWISQGINRRIVCISFQIHAWIHVKCHQVTDKLDSFMAGASESAQWLYYYDRSSLLEN
jgi:hypothetical protein